MPSRPRQQQFCRYGFTVSGIRYAARESKVPEKFFVEHLPNGLTLLGQRMEHVSSVAVALLAPCGSAHDPDGLEGAATVGVEWRMRGAGDRNTRQLNDALDSLGCQHDESVLSEHVEFSMALLSRNLPQAMPILADILLRPRLEDAGFEPCRALTLQDLASLEDEPARKCNVLLRERFFPHPLGRNAYGRPESLRAMTPRALREHLQGNLSADGAILSVAGDIDWNGFRDMARRQFGDWPARKRQPVTTTPRTPGMTHIKKESAQEHIAIAHAAVPLGDKRSYAALMAEKVLSGGMSGRLFTEVREKRGLVYHVSSHYYSLKDYAAFFTYAGTRPDVAQQTLDVTVGELRRLAQGVEEDEMARARTQLKSALVMQGESTMARANALAGDWHHLHRLRGLKEISDAVDAVTAGEVIDYIRDFPATNFTAMVIGPQQLDLSAING